MDSYLMENFGDVKAKNSSKEALQWWGKACWLVKNPKRRFRFTANLSDRSEADAIRRTFKTNFKVAVIVSQAAIQYIQGLSDYEVPENVEAAGFQICAEELGSIVEGHDVKRLTSHGGVEGIVGKLSTSVTDGISTSSNLIDKRKVIFGINKFMESPTRGFWFFVMEALQDMTLMILAVCAFVSLIVGIMMEGWPKGAHDGLGIVASIMLVVFVTATSDYRQSLQFKDLDAEKKKISVQVTRNGYRQKLSIYDLLAGDIVHLNIGDQVPADGLFINGDSLLINESSLTGESEEPVHVSDGNPFLLSGTKVQDGSCKMLVTTVGMRTQWGKLMATLSESGDDETPLQVKLNGVATLIGKVGLFFAVITFAMLVQGLLSRKYQEGSVWSLSGDDAMEILIFAAAVTIVVVAVPEGLPLAVMLRSSPEDVDAAGYQSCAEELESIVEGHNEKKLRSHEEKRVIRNGLGRKLSTYDLLPGDILHLNIGDQVPADGLFISGGSLLINLSSLTGDSKPVHASGVGTPFLLPGKEVQYLITQDACDPCSNDRATCNDFIHLLVRDLDSCCLDKQKQAALKIRCLAKNKPENRVRIARAGAIKPLITLISSSDPEVQEHSVTAILNLSLCHENKKLIQESGAIEWLVTALREGTLTVKENAACVLLELSRIKENMVAIGRSGAIPLLVNLLESGGSQGKEDACAALYLLCSTQENKVRVVEAGAMRLLVGLMAHLRSSMVDKAASVVKMLVGAAEAQKALVEEEGIPVLVELVELGTQRQKEIAVGVLLKLCEDSVEYRTKVGQAGAVPFLMPLAQSGANSRKRKKCGQVKKLMELLRPSS